MTKRYTTENVTFILALLVGLCASASYTTFFYSSIVSFTIFPFIGLILATYCLHQRYIVEPMPHGAASICIASCFVGLLGYNVAIKVSYPELGSGLIQTFLLLALVFWLAKKMQVRRKNQAVKCQQQKS